MPTKFVQNVAKRTGTSVEHAEKVWHDAKQAVKKGKRQGSWYWGKVVNTFKRMMGIKEAITFAEFSQLFEEADPMREMWFEIGDRKQFFTKQSEWEQKYGLDTALYPRHVFIEDMLNNHIMKKKPGKSSSVLGMIRDQHRMSLRKFKPALFVYNSDVSTPNIAKMKEIGLKPLFFPPDEEQP